MDKELLIKAIDDLQEKEIRDSQIRADIEIARHEGYNRACRELRELVGSGRTNMSKYDVIPADVKEYYNQRLEESGIRRVSGHYPVLKTKQEVDGWIEMFKMMFESAREDDDDE